jgi:hypothetical protein
MSRGSNTLNATSSFGWMMGGLGGMMGGYQGMMGSLGFPFGFMQSFMLVGLVSGIIIMIGAVMLDALFYSSTLFLSYSLSFSQQHHTVSPYITAPCITVYRVYHTKRKNRAI